MSFIAEYKVRSPILRESRTAVPEMVFRAEERSLRGEPTFIYWAEGEAFETHESALETDPYTTGFEVLTETDDRRLYRLTLSDKAVETTTYPDAAEQGIVVQEATAQGDRSFLRARVPSRDALKAYREAFADRSIPFELRGLYRDTDEEDAGRYGLTPAQRTALVRAHERGYFEEPRQVSLEELAAEFDVSPSAIGRRLRRAEDALVRETLRREDPD